MSVISERKRAKQKLSLLEAAKIAAFLMLMTSVLLTVVWLAPDRRDICAKRGSVPELFLCGRP